MTNPELVGVRLQYPCVRSEDDNLMPEPSRSRKPQPITFKQKELIAIQCLHTFFIQASFVEFNKIVPKSLNEILLK